jgi:hypothetical protein
LGLGVWGFGFGAWGIGPNPQSPIPNPHFYFLKNKIVVKNIIKILIIIFKKNI